jgi:hypothetical protein
VWVRVWFSLRVWFRISMCGTCSSRPELLAYDVRAGLCSQVFEGVDAMGFSGLRAQGVC